MKILPPKMSKYILIEIIVILVYASLSCKKLIFHFRLKYLNRKEIDYQSALSIKTKKI